MGEGGGVRTPKGPPTTNTGHMAGVGRVNYTNDTIWVIIREMTRGNGLTTSYNDKHWVSHSVGYEETPLIPPPPL